MKSVIDRTIKFSDEIAKLSLDFDGYIYNPLSYALDAHLTYLEKATQESAYILFLGMNPGPFGMMQTGVPFGSINAVKEYLKISSTVNKPENEHPSRRILGFDIKREEISGKRLWALIEEIFPSCDDFFSSSTVQNYCPLAFIDKAKSARNITPDKLSINDRAKISKVCDSYLIDILALMNIKIAIGVGNYAYQKLNSICSSECKVLKILHPSPASPLSNREFFPKNKEILLNEVYS